MNELEYYVIHTPKIKNFIINFNTFIYKLITKIK